MKAFIVALQFLTRFPTPRLHEVAERDTAMSLLFYPLIGALMGAVLWWVDGLLQPLALNSALHAALILALWVWLSGGLHLDGVADCADAVAGGRGDRERMLALMKDPGNGTAAVLQLVLLLLLKWAALITILHNGLAVLLVAVLALGRGSVLFLFATTPYVRSGGLGQAMTRARPAWLFAAFLLTLGAVAYWSYPYTPLVLAYALHLMVMRWVWLRRIGGITGDVCGQLIEGGELVMLLAIIVLPVLHL